MMIDTSHILIATNISLIIAVTVLIVRLTWFLAKMDARIDAVNDRAMKAHERIDAHKIELREIRDRVTTLSGEL